MEKGGAYRALKVAMGEKSSCLLCALQSGLNIVAIYLWPPSITAKIHSFENYELTF